MGHNNGEMLFTALIGSEMEIFSPGSWIMHSSCRRLPVARRSLRDALVSGIFLQFSHEQIASGSITAGEHVFVRVQPVVFYLPNYTY